MTKKYGRGRRGKQPPQRRPIRQPVAAPAEDPTEQALLLGLRESLRADEPLDLLLNVSGILAALDSRRRGPDSKDEEGPTQADLIASFIDTSYAETTAALTVIRAFGTDEMMDARIGRELAQRRQPMPGWLTRLAETKAEPPVWLLTNVLRDVDDYMFGVSLPSGHSLSASVLVDNNAGSVVKDAFMMARPLDDVVQHIQAFADHQDNSLALTDAATARAVIEDAIWHGTLLLPPFETDTWPLCRPLISWMLRLLPDDGRRPERPEWSDEQRAELAKDFFASSFGAGLDDPDHRLLLEPVLDFAIDYGAGDPLVWSGTRVELLLLDWFPRKVAAAPSHLTKLPELLRAYIRYAHQRAGISRSATVEPLEALDEYAPEYQRLIRTERLQGPEALMARMFEESGDAAAGLDIDLMDDLLDPQNPMDTMQRVGLAMLESLAAAVGGHYQLRNLGVEPLPDEPFEWAGIADDIRPTVTDVMAHCDRCAEELLDVEHRTAMRRFLGRAAVVDPAPFRRKASPIRLAAAVAWAVGLANRTVGDSAGGLSVTDLMTWFGVKGTVSQRAEPLLRANGINPTGFIYGRRLGTADLLVSSCRANMVAERDRWLKELRPEQEE